MPWSREAPGLGKLTWVPSSSTVPAVGSWTPAMILTSVDLPAPLSPTSATISPVYTSRSTCSRATTPPKVLRIPRMARVGVLVLVVAVMAASQRVAGRGLPSVS